ncbi:hypothetical protein DACRYDRAFT_118479 [Dacryopinax primogenitus]|uniref:Uncharacterized protein n=1 Tax=Dacryopinax primogenitus (strain DJM 731) TaxID=1858805 RepID=M5FPM8_DACPD|nr:uncharacterized protein DACRYDRAFT_118479 [Dacryopinax primogenitus]EJT98670.1 hypothetical protein DACRYDRAFT_118479 [Dacryopinax primogenitus]
MTREFVTAFATFLATPIHSLPSEILLDIFDLAIDEIWTRNTKEGHDCAFKLSHVCHRWRNIMLNYSVMWHRIYIGDGHGQRSRTLECFRRIKNNRHFELNASPCSPYVVVDEDASGPALDIDINCGDSNKYCAGAVLCKNLHRVRKLRITASAEPMRVMSRYCKEPAPLLEELTIVPHGGSVRWATYITGVDMDEMFKKKSPRLRKVDVTLVHLRWPSPLLKDLRVLIVRYAPFGDWPQLYDLLDSLCASPELEELHLLCPPGALHSSYPEIGPAQDLFRDLVSDPIRADNTRVILKKLKMVALENAFLETIPMLLPFLDVPNGVELKLIADDDQSNLRLGPLPKCDFLDRAVALRITGLGFESRRASARLAALIDAMPKLTLLKLHAGAGQELVQHYIRELEDTTNWAN